MRSSDIVHLLQNRKYVLFEIIQIIFILVIIIFTLLLLQFLKTINIKEKSLLLIGLMSTPHFLIDQSIDIQFVGFQFQLLFFDSFGL